jgi:hypothetical protein
MVCRAIRLAALSVVFALVAWAGVFAQNLDAGKTPAQIFSGTCSACHSTPRGLLKSVGPGQLPGFLRQHYTTGSEMAGTLAGFLIQSGAGVKADAPPARTMPKGARKAPDAPAATADVPAAPSKGKGRQTTTIPTTVDGAPADAPAPAAKRQSKGKKGDDKRAPAAVATPEPVVAPGAKPEAKPETAATPDVKPEPVPEKKPEAPPVPLPVEAEHQPTPPAAATPADAAKSAADKPAADKPAAEPGPVIIVVPRAEPSVPAASAPSDAPSTPAPQPPSGDQSSKPAAPAAEAPAATPPTPAVPAAPSGETPPTR